MAYTFLVLVSRKSLPELATLGPILRKAKVPLSITESWSWTKDSGWLPMTWRGTESGCEVEFGKLSKKQAAAAKEAGHPGLDAAIAITTRGWESLQCGVCFGAALALAASGCISEDDDEYIAPDAAMRWAKKSVRVADKQVQLEEAQDAAKAEALSSGNVEGQLEAALAGMVGAEVKELGCDMGYLDVALKDGRRVFGSAWRLLARDGTEHATDRYPTLRTRQARLMGGSRGAKQEKEIDALDEQLDQASALDEQGSETALKEVKSWPRALKIQSVTWTRPNIIDFAFDAGTGIKFVGGWFGTINCNFPPLKFSVTDEGVELS